jgi:HD superfamily phosphohydrolase
MILRDPVHGLVAFESDEANIVPLLLEAREVQRLRRIRQLGLTSFAFPGAEHTRFAHAVGAAHVMQLLVARLRQIDGELPFWQRMTSERARDAIAAALLHDIGHGPFSHLFEEAMPGGVHHETWTRRILLSPESDVHRILSRRPGLPQRVAETRRWSPHAVPGERSERCVRRRSPRLPAAGRARHRVIYDYDLPGCSAVAFDRRRVPMNARLVWQRRHEGAHAIESFLPARLMFSR